MNYKQIYKKNELIHNFDLINVGQGVYVPFPNNKEDILVSSSGGADSALLVYILAKHITTNNLKIKIHMLQFERMWKTRPWQIKIAEHVFNTLSSMFPTVEFIRHTYAVSIEVECKKIGDVEFGQVLVMDDILEKTCYMNNVTVAYNATTCNPMGVTLVSEIPSRNFTYDDINDDNVISLLHSWRDDFVFANPFIFIDKSWIIKQYKDNNILSLLNATRSCEGEYNNKNYKTWDGNFEKLEDCNSCFWCAERNWALDKNELLQFKNKWGKIE